MLFFFPSQAHILEEEFSCPHPRFTGHCSLATTPTLLAKADNDLIANFSGKFSLSYLKFQVSLTLFLFKYSEATDAITVCSDSSPTSLFILLVKKKIDPPCLSLRHQCLCDQSFKIFFI